MSNSNKFFKKISTCFLVFICILISTPIISLYACASDKKMSCCEIAHKGCCCHKSSKTNLVKKISQENLKTAGCNCVEERQPFNKTIDQTLSFIKDIEHSEYLNFNKNNTLCLLKQNFCEKVCSNKHLFHNKTIAMLNTVKLLI